MTPPSTRLATTLSGLIDTYNGTTWTATPAPLPSNAYTTYPAVLLDSVSCSSATSGVAVGEFDAEVGGTQIGYEALHRGPGERVLDGSDRCDGQP